MTVYQIVTERIIQSLEQGIIPWRRPWKVAGHPRNFTTCKPYRGINILLLATQGDGSPYWLTYKQATERGGCVKKGEKATPIVFWKVGQKVRQEAGEQELDRVFLLRYYNVFNVEQTTLAPAESSALQPLAPCSAVVDGWQQKPRLIVDDPTVSQAEYFPKLDAVAMPLMSRFHSSEQYYATLFHELVHSTGHPSRLNREGIANSERFGTERYSKEELVAEIGSAFLCAHTGITKPEIETNTTAYLQNWITALKGDSRLIVSAAAQAQHAVDMILGVQPETDPEEVTCPAENGTAISVAETQPEEVRA